MSGETDQTRWRGVQPVQGIRGIWPGRDATRLQESGYKNGVGITIIYTVPAGKKMFMANGGLVTKLATQTEDTARMGIRDSEDALKHWIFYHYYEVAGQQSSYVGFVPALEAEAGDDIFVESTGGQMSARAFAFGWLEDA